MKKMYIQIAHIYSEPQRLYANELVYSWRWIMVIQMLEATLVI